MSLFEGRFIYYMKISYLSVLPKTILIKAFCLQKDILLHHLLFRAQKLGIQNLQVGVTSVFLLLLLVRGKTLWSINVMCPKKLALPRQKLLVFLLTGRCSRWHLCSMLLVHSNIPNVIKLVSMWLVTEISNVGAGGSVGQVQVDAEKRFKNRSKCDQIGEHVIGDRNIQCWCRWGGHSRSQAPPPADSNRDLFCSPFCDNIHTHTHRCAEKGLKQVKINQHCKYFAGTLRNYLVLWCTSIEVPRDTFKYFWVLWGTSRYFEIILGTIWYI